MAAPMAADRPLRSLKAKAILIDSRAVGLGLLELGQLDVVGLDGLLDLGPCRCPRTRASPGRRRRWDRSACSSLMASATACAHADLDGGGAGAVGLDVRRAVHLHAAGETGGQDDGHAWTSRIFFIAIPPGKFARPPGAGGRRATGAGRIFGFVAPMIVDRAAAGQQKTVGARLPPRRIMLHKGSETPRPQPANREISAACPPSPPASRPMTSAAACPWNWTPSWPTASAWPPPPTWAPAPSPWAATAA